MIAKLDWTKSSVQQNIEQLQKMGQGEQTRSFTSPEPLAQSEQLWS